MTDLVRASLSEGVLHLELNRPAKKNALTRAMYTVLSDALEAARDDAAQRVVLFSGAGDAFTAGNDIADFAASRGRLDEVARFITLLVDYPLPLVAAVHGAAVGIGTTMLLHCDLAWAAPSARFKTPFVDLGLVPEAGSSLLMPRAFGYARAAQLLLLGDTLDADTAALWGLVNGVVPEGELLAVATAAARKLATRAPSALRAAKALMRGNLRAELLATVQVEGERFKEHLTSPEAVEALTAFMQKRAPDFSRFS